MSVLGGVDLRKRLEAKADDPKRLVVSPILEPDEQLKADSASIDVRLGFEFALISPSLIAAIGEFDLAKDVPRHVALSQLFKKQYVSFGSDIVIHPHQFILAATLEYLRLPRDLMAYVVGRSTWGRLGLTVATAIGIHPSFAGVLTLELRNLGETPLRLYPGDLIAQLFFHTAAGDVVPEDTAKGQYIGAVDLLPRSLSPPRTHKKLEALLKSKKK